MGGKMRPKEIRCVGVKYTASAQNNIVFQMKLRILKMLLQDFGLN